MTAQPIVAPPKAAGCQPLLDHLRYLCSAHPDPDGAYTWLLRWIAYPLQHRGAKMGSAVFMHGPAGNGKSTFWTTVASLYRADGVHLRQDDLESPFNTWASGARFVLVDDLGRMGALGATRLKPMITEPTWMVNTKGLPLRREENAANFVFLSNAADALPIGPGDRRYFVCAAPAVWDDAAIDRVGACLMAGGTSALCDYLLGLPLGDFGPHTPPPATAPAPYAASHRPPDGPAQDPPMSTTAQILHGPVRAPDSAAARWRRRLVMLWLERAYRRALRRRVRNEQRVRHLARQRQRARVALGVARGML